MKLRQTVAVLAVLSLVYSGAVSFAADPTSRQGGDAVIAAKSAEIELLRGRLSANPSSSASTSLLEAENLLRQLKTAPPAKRASIASQLDAALARVELEIGAVQHDRR